MDLQRKDKGNVVAALRRLWAIALYVSEVMDKRNLGLIAAGVAFYSILAVFPGLAAVIALWGVIGDPGLVAAEIGTYDALLPEEVETLLLAQLEALATTDGLTLGWASVISLGLAIWSARAGAAALIRGLNAIFNVPNRSGLSHYARALFLTLALIGVALVALMSVVVLPVILAFIPLGFWTAILFFLTRWSVAIGVLLAGFWLIYRLGPNRKNIRVWPGALLAVILWTAASAGFSVYLTNFGSYNEVYGSIGAVIAMLMWLFISAWLVLVGGALNAWLSQSEQPEPDGQDRQGRADQHA